MGVVAADVTASSPMKLNFFMLSVTVNKPTSLLHSSLTSLNGGGGHGAVAPHGATHLLQDPCPVPMVAQLWYSSKGREVTKQRDGGVLPAAEGGRSGRRVCCASSS